MLVSSFYVNNLYSLVAFAFVIHITAGFTFNNYFAYCLARFPNSAGVSGGLTGGFTYIITSALSYGIVAVIQPQMQFQVAEGYLILGGLGLIILMMTQFRKAHA